jgi:hypothetical protein
LSLDIPLSGPLQLSAARAAIVSVTNSRLEARDVYLPMTGIQNGDIIVVVGGAPLVNPINVKVPAAGGAAIVDPNGGAVTISVTGQQYRFIVDGVGNFIPWTRVNVDTHTHVLADVTGAAASGSITTSGLTQATARILGRTTGSTGAVEELAASNVRSFLNVADGAEQNVNADWNASSGDAQILNKPTLAASATTDTTNASNISSGTLATARMGSGTPSASNYLRGDGSWQTVTAGVGGGTGATDNAIIRADGTGGSTVQSSDINIEDATTSTANNVTISNLHSGQTNSSLVLNPKGTGAFVIGPKPDGTTTGGNARGTYAVDLQWSPRFAATNVASGNRSIILNGENNTSSGSDAISGGSANVASGVSAVALGFAATASGNYTFAAGYRPTASGANGTVALGANTSATINGQFAFSSGRPSGSGISQFTVFTLYGNTTGTGTTELFGGADQGGTVRLSVPSGHIMHGLVHIIGTKNDGLTVATYSRQVAIKNVSGTGTTSLVGSVTAVGADLASGTSISITANDTNDALKIDCTGPTAGETWRWIALCEFAQRTYAN